VDDAAGVTPLILTMSEFLAVLSAMHGLAPSRTLKLSDAPASGSLTNMLSMSLAWRSSAPGRPTEAMTMSGINSPPPKER
jgi:hypothetical protein